MNAKLDDDMLIKKIAAIYLAGVFAIISLVSCGIPVSINGEIDNKGSEDDSEAMDSLFCSGMRSFAGELFKAFALGTANRGHEDPFSDLSTCRVSSELTINRLRIFNTEVITPERRFISKSDSYYNNDSRETYTCVGTSFSGEELLTEMYRHSGRAELSFPGLTDKLLILPCGCFLPYDIADLLSAGVKIDDSCFRYETVPYRNGEIEFYDSELLELSVPDSSLVVPVLSFTNNGITNLTVRSITLHFSEGSVFAADLELESEENRYLLNAAVWNGYDSAEVKMDFYLKSGTDLNLVSFDLKISLDSEKNITGSLDFYADTAMLSSLGFTDDFGINDLCIEAEINSKADGNDRTAEIESVIEYDIYGISNRIDLPVYMITEEKEGGLDILFTTGHSDDEITAFECSLAVKISGADVFDMKSVSKNLLENSSLYFLNSDESYNSIRSDLVDSFKEKYRYISSLIFLDDRSDDNDPVSMLCAYDPDEKTSYVIYVDRSTLKGNGERTVCLNYSYGDKEVQIFDERGNIVFLIPRKDLLNAVSDSEGIHITDSSGRRFTFTESGKCYVSTPIVISCDEHEQEGSLTVDYSYLYKTKVNRKVNVVMSGGYIVISGSDKKIRYVIY